MTVEQIPTSRTLATYSQRTRLGDRDYILEFQFNQRAHAWYLDLSTESGRPLISGVRVVSNEDLLRSLRDPEAPKGTLIAVDARPGGSPPRPARDPGFSQLGGVVRLLFVTA